MARNRQKAQPKLDASKPASRVQLLTVLLLPLLLYANTLRHDFALDDIIVYRDNRFVQQGIGGIPEILTSDAFAGYTTRESALSGGRYRPLSMLTFALEYQLWKLRPSLSHLVNILLYAANCLLVYVVLTRLLPNSRLPLLASLLFVAHPTHTEVVANIKGRDEVLCFIFVLLSVLAILDKRHVLAGLAFSLAMFAKESAITFLAVIPVVLCWQGESLRCALKRTSPCLIATLIFILVRTSVVGFLGDRGSTNLLLDPFALSTTGERLATSVWALGRYLWLLLFPHPLSCDYSHAHFGIRKWADFAVLASLVLHLAGAYFAVCGVRSRRGYGVLLLCYFATMSIVANIVFPVGTILADRFVYMPSLAFCIALAALVVQRGKPGLIVLAVILLPYCGKTVHRNLAWKDNWTLVNADIKSCPNSARLHAMLGEQSWERGLKEQALVEFERALQIYPDSSSVHRSIGLIYANNADYPKAIHHLSEAVTRDKRDMTARYNLGLALAITGDSAEAIEHLRILLKAEPKHAMGHLTLGQTLCGKGKWADALAHLQAAHELNPGLGTVARDLGVCLYELAEFARARPLLEAHLKANPNDAKVADMLRRAQ
jgi:tetratricopeptide (TPR) repeat protein